MNNASFCVCFYCVHIYYYVHIYYCVHIYFCIHFYLHALRIPFVIPIKVKLYLKVAAVLKTKKREMHVNI